VPSLSSPDCASAAASATKSRGTQIPSLRPLSTFSPWRMRDGRLGSVTTACPSAASVGARRMPTTRASTSVSEGKSAAAAAAPATTVSGSPIPSRRAGTAYSRRSARRSILAASAKSTSVSVASARPRTVWPVGGNSTSPSTFGPKRRPMPTKTIAAVTGVPSSRRDTAA